ncbi:unnamed protein product [Fusarium graminearum]|nr:unnamed protein product [Fusarium graminearum]CAG2006315.1 unnamed protein product [Fusarium graminearum]VTO85916.1 unnamed protein product [Fusarium graminearum]
MRRKIATTTSGSITTGNNAIFSVPDPPSGISVAAGALVFKTGMARKCASNKDDHVIHDESSRLNNGSTVPYKDTPSQSYLPPQSLPLLYFSLIIFPQLKNSRSTRYMFFIMETRTELLYHVLLTVINYHNDLSGAQRSTYVLGTRGSIESAKSSAYRVLNALRYTADDFAEYAVHSSHQGTWRYGQGVLVYARTPAGRAFFISVQATPNDDQFPVQYDGSILLPGGISSLQYILQTTIDYNNDRSGARQETQIEGTFLHKSEALAAARNLLDPLDFEDFETPEKMDGEWPYGDNVVVHAISESGLNIFITLQTASCIEETFHSL